MPAKLPVFYDCSNCPAHCCAYEHTPVTERDITRLARHFSLSLGLAREQLTRAVRGQSYRVLRRTRDRIFGLACRFLDRATRHCTIYEARPAICRAYPGTPRCGFYDFLMAERRSQNDPKHVPSFRRGCPGGS